MSYIFTAIVLTVVLIGIVDPIVKIWDRLDPPTAKITETHNRKDHAV